MRRRTRMRDERGVVELAAGLVIGLGIAATVMTVLIVQTIAAEMAGDARRPSGGGGYQKAFVGPELPGTAGPACAEKAARSAGLVWTGHGYRKMAGDDEPYPWDFYEQVGRGKPHQTSADAVRAYNAALDAWLGQMKELVTQAKATWDRDCAPPKDIVVTPGPAVTTKRLPIEGTYQLEEQGRSGSCGITATTLTVGPVTQEPDPNASPPRDGIATFVLAGGSGEANTFPMGFSPELYFSGQTAVPDINAGGNFSGGADAVRLSLIVANTGMDCQVSYSALKLAPPPGG